MVGSGPPPRPRTAAELVGCGRVLSARGLTPQASGNASVRTNATVLITAGGARMGELTEAALVEVDQAGARVGGAARASSELALHLEVYRRRPDVGAVVHTHGRHAVALSSLVTRVPALHYYCTFLGGSPVVAPYRTYGSPELATVTADALGHRHAVVMSHHGSLTVGEDLATATDRAELVEWLCEVALLALAAGTPIELDDADLDAVARRAGQGAP